MMEAEMSSNSNAIKVNEEEKREERGDGVIPEACDDTNNETVEKSGESGSSRGRKGSSERSGRSSYHKQRKSKSREWDRTSRRETRKSERRSRRRSRSRSTSSKSNSRSGSWNRKRGNCGGRMHHYSSGASGDDYSDYNVDKRCANYKPPYQYQEPNSTVMVRGLAEHLNESDIQREIIACGIMTKEIRLIRNRETGASRGFAFVEFKSVEDATRWIDMKKGVLVLQGKFHANLIYSTPKVPISEGVDKMLTDWICGKCTAQNFRRRKFCYKCYDPRSEVRQVEHFDEISSQPTTIIILGNLDILTTEENVLQAFQSVPSLACIPIKSVKIAREPDTSISKGICYLGANNIVDALSLMTILSLRTFEIDGRTVLATYGKITNPATMSKNINAAATALAAAQWTNRNTTATLPAPPSSVGPPCTEVKTEADIEQMAQYYANLYAKTTEEFLSHLDYYRNYYKQEVAKSWTSSAVSGQFPWSDLHHQTEQHRHQPPQSIPYNRVVAASGSLPSHFSPRSLQTQQVTGVPDKASYLCDETKGGYFDPGSSMKYGAANHQSFYDSGKLQFLQSSQGKESGKDVVVPHGGVNKRKGEKVGKQDVGKTARRIKKEMKKWAKTLNTNKDTISQSTVVPASSDLESGDMITSKFSVYTMEENFTTYLPAGLAASVNRMQSEYSNSNNEGQREVIAVCRGDSDFVDEDKLACLLCKRKFLSKDILHKHVTMSSLHKENLKALQYGESLPIAYRDRANERRKTFGSDKDVINNEQKELYLQTKMELSSRVEEPTRQGIEDDNIGNRMLRNMGWQEGQGLGMSNQGRVDIISTERRAGKLGLGITGTEVIDERLDSQTKARMITLARYQELR